MQPFFSIIIPVYNVEKYIRECIESIITQMFDDYEVILIDDGSTDNSGNICREYCEKYDNIKYCRIENNGASAARNVGIGKAIGRYIAFLDSDDYWCDKDFLHNSKKILSEDNADMMIFGYRELSEDGNEKVIMMPDMKQNVVYTYTDVENCGIYKSSAWSKFVKSRIVTENKLKFEEGVTSEDIVWCAELARVCNTYSVYSSAPYVYRQRVGSVTRSIDAEQFRNLIRHVKETSMLKYDDNKKAAANNYAAYQYITVLYNLVHHKDEISSAEYNEIKKMSYLLQYRNNKKVKLIYWANKILGFDIMLKLVGIYIEKRR